MNGLAAMPPAFARLIGSSSSMGRRKSLMRFPSSTLKWYFSRRTSGNAHGRRRWMLRRSPFLLKISVDHLPVVYMAEGKLPSNSITWAT